VASKAGPQAIGVDIGGTKLRAARVTAAGEIVASASERVSREPEAALGRILDVVHALDAETVVGVGIGIPGRVDSREGRVLSGGFLNLADVALAERVEGRIGKPVLLDNDCNMALVAELRIGAALGCSDVAMFTIGTGIGGALALGGAIVRGRSCAGQLGHVTVDVGGRPCNCGRRGCVETTSSGTALGRLIAEAGLPAETRVETLLARADASDGVAKDVLLAWAGPLRAAIDSMVASVDPERVLLGGGLGQAACRALALAPAVSPWYQCPVVQAALGDDAGVIGAALAVIEADGR